MSFTNNFLLNKELSQIKTFNSELNLKIISQNAILNEYQTHFRFLKKNMDELKKNTKKKIDSEVSQITNIIVDVIQDVQNLKMDFDDLVLKLNEFKDINNEKIENEEQSNEKKLEECKDIIDFLKTNNFDEKYISVVINLGCKKKEDLTYFSEEELIESGFLKLHSRQILKLLTNN